MWALSLLITLSASVRNNYHAFPPDAPLRSFNISTTNRLPGGGLFHPTPVLKSGRPVGKWATCLPKSPHSSCFRLARFEDRISFHYEVSSEIEEAFDHLEPKISSSSKRAHPCVFDFNVDSSGGRFTVLLGCVNGGSEESVMIAVLLETVSESPITLRFAATCATGKHPYVSAHALRSLPPPRLGPILLPLIVPYHEIISTVLVRVHSPARAQIHGIPIVTSRRPSSVRVKLRGLSANGTFLSSIPTKLTLMYECIDSRASVINLRIPIPPWKDLQCTF
eukprot:IDg16955t1